MSTRAQEKIAVLKQVRKLIEPKKEFGFICLALGFIPGAAAADLTEYVSESLGKYPTLDNWVRRNTSLPCDPKSVQRYRLQWIDWMIEQLSCELEGTGKCGCPTTCRRNMETKPPVMFVSVNQPEQLS